MFNQEDAPFEVVDLEVPPSNDQIGGDVIESAQKVGFTISKASVRKSEDGSVARLNIQAKVGPMGVDGNGKYTGKVIFAEPIVYVDTNVKTSDWWKKQARFPWKQLQGALGMDASAGVRINDSFLTSLQGKEFVADIKKEEMRVKNSEGVYVGTGDFKNTLANFKKSA